MNEQEKDQPGQPGRPTDYKALYCRQARVVCSKGATEEDLADLFNVNVDTIYEWKKVHAPFSEAIERGKRKADKKVERSLYERANGYHHKSEKIFCSEGSVVRAPCIEKYPPEVQAIRLWLMNRRPDKWRDRQDIGLSGGIRMLEVLVANPAEKAAIDAAMINLKMLDAPTPTEPPPANA